MATNSPGHDAVIGVALAVLAGLSYGSSDFGGAIASKDNAAALVAVAVQAVSLAALLAVLAVFPEQHRTLEDLAWAALGGVGAAVGLTMFYIALARGPISTAASITGLVGAMVPLITGLALGDRPSRLALAGVLLSMPAVVLLAANPRDMRMLLRASTLREWFAGQGQRQQTWAWSLGAGLAFGLFFVSLSRTSTEAGLFPLLGVRAASITVLVIVVTLRRSWQPITRSSRKFVVVAGVLDCAANGFYITALGYGTFVWVAAITSLYPVATVLLARTFLRERLTSVQLAGLSTAAAALVLIAVGR